MVNVGVAVPSAGVNVCVTVKLAVAVRLGLTVGLTVRETVRVRVETGVAVAGTVAVGLAVKREAGSMGFRAGLRLQAPAATTTKPKPSIRAEDL